MTFNSNLQLWVDDNGQPLTVQPPKPMSNQFGGYQNSVPPIDNSLDGFNYISSNQIPLENSNSIYPNFNPENGSMGQPSSLQMQGVNLSSPSPMSSYDFSNTNQEINQLGTTSTPSISQGENKSNIYDFMNNASNAVNKSYSLESSLYGLGYAVSPKDYTGMTEQQIGREKTNNTLLGIGSAGKLLTGGLRTFMSGAANGKMDNWVINNNRNKRREALVNNATGVQYAYPSVPTYQDGGQTPEDVVAQLQMAVQNGEMSEEEAQAYLDQMQGNQEAPQDQSVQDLQGQLNQAVQSGEMSEEEAMAYFQQVQQSSNQNQPQQSQQPQISPEEAQEQLAMAVENGEISPDEAKTYLQQLYGNVEANSQPKEAYTGAVREKIKPEEYLTGEVTTGDENKPHNAEVEKGEYLNREGVTQQVIGDKHSKGGEKMNLESGTIIISDKGRIGTSNAKALSLNTGMKLKAGDTYAQVLDIFNKKIGLNKLNEEQEELFKKIQKYEGKGNEKTQELNNNFLNLKINDIEDKKKSLLAQREQLVQVLFELQEKDKPKEESNSQAVPTFQDGGEYVLNRYGKDAYQYYLDNWKNDPDYNFRDYGQMRNRLRGFAEDFGVSLPQNFDKFNESQMNDFAGQLQNTVDDSTAIHYGTYVAPTQNGLQWLIDNGIVDKDNKALKSVVKNGKVSVGSYGSLNKDQQQIVANAVDNLDPETLNKYAVSNFRDNKWFYRRPKEETVYYKDKNEFDTVINDSQKVRDGVYYSGKQGAYFKPILLQEKKLGSLQEVEEYKKKFGSNADKVHKDFLSEGDPMTYNLVSADQQETSPIVDNDSSVNGFNGVRGSRRRSNVFLMPDQSTLPPEALRAVPKYDIRYNYLDNVRLSPEQNLVENYRALNESRAKMEGLPDVMNQANLAMLTGNVAQANNQAINQINAQNVQLAQGVAQANNNILNRQAEMDLKLADQYDERMNRALDVTRKDIEGYYDFNRKVNVGEFNTRQQLSLLNDLFNNYGINSDGTIAFDPKTNAPFEVDRFQAIETQRLLDEENRKRKIQKTKTPVTKTKVSDNWTK